MREKAGEGYGMISQNETSNRDTTTERQRDTYIQADRGKVHTRQIERQRNRERQRQTDRQTETNSL